MKAYLQHSNNNKDSFLTESVDCYEMPLWYHKRGLMQTATGYGSKLKTPYKVRWNNRSYRVYSVCFSNVSTEYIISNKQKITVRLDT